MIDTEQLAEKHGLSPKARSLDEIAHLAYEEQASPLRIRNRNLNRHLAFSLIATVLAVATLAIVVLRRPPVVVKAFLVDRASGRVLALGTAVTPDHWFGQKVERQALETWIWNARSVLSEPNAQLVMIHRVIAQTTEHPNATAFMRRWYDEHNPLSRAKEGTVTVDIRNVLHLSEHTYQVVWTEHQFGPDGSPQGTENWRGTFSVMLRIPAIEDDAPSDNPLGFYVTNISWSKDQDHA